MYLFVPPGRRGRVDSRRRTCQSGLLAQTLERETEEGRQKLARSFWCQVGYPAFIGAEISNLAFFFLTLKFQLLSFNPKRLDYWMWFKSWLSSTQLNREGGTEEEVRSKDTRFLLISSRISWFHPAGFSNYHFVTLKFQLHPKILGLLDVA